MPNPTIYRRILATQNSSTFSFASLGLEVDVLMNETDSAGLQLKYLGDLALDASQTNGAAVAMIDRSANKEILSSNESDFSVDADGVTSSQMTLVANQTINSEGGFLKWVGLTGTAQTSCTLPNAFLLGVNGLTVMRFKFRWAWGTNDSTMGGFYQYFPLGRRDFLIAARPFGVTYETELYLVQASLKNLGMAGGSVDRIGKDLIYIKDIITEEIDGNHFINIVVSASPTRNHVDYTLDFDGIGDYFHNAPFAAAITSDTAGMFTMYIRDDEGAGQVCQIFDINDGGLTNYLTIRLDSSNNIRIYTARAAGGTNNANFGPITAMRGGWIQLQIGSTGTGYVVRANGVAQSLVSGTDNGQWLGDLAGLTTAWMGRGHTASYGVEYATMGLRHFGYKSGGIFTDKEIENINALPEYQEVYTP